MNREEYDMNLPQGKTCADCAYCFKCVSMFGAKETNIKCDFSPSAFKQKSELNIDAFAVKTAKEFVQSEYPHSYCSRRAGGIKPRIYMKVCGDVIAKGKTISEAWENAKRKIEYKKLIDKVEINETRILPPTKN